MPIQNPTQLVDEFKKSGEFDRLRRELLAQFRDGDGLAPFVTRVEDITRRKLQQDQRLLYLAETAMNRELHQELNRYPIVDRATSEVPSLRDPDFRVAIRQQLTQMLRDDRNGGASSTTTAARSNTNTPQTRPPPTPFQPTPSNASPAIPGSTPTIPTATPPQPSSQDASKPTLQVDTETKALSDDEGSAMDESPISPHEESASRMSVVPE